MSFKYRFILSFVVLEIFFILLIVTVNFITINNSSNKLTAEKIKSNITFLEQLVKVPISIYDIATLDNLLENSKKLKYINSIIILDNQDRVISSEYFYKHMPQGELLKTKRDLNVSINNEIYEVKYKRIYVDNTFLGSLYIIFDSTENFRFINENKKNTAIIIFLEILISMCLAYVIGARLTEKLSKLSTIALQIGDNKHPKIPFLNKKDEIGILAKSMNQMQIDLKSRNDKLNELANTLQIQKNDLIKVNNYKNEFLANMSHELKTPLNSINVISSLMMSNSRKSFTDREVKNLKIVNSCGNDLLFLINDILDISKIEAGELVINFDQMDMYKLAVEIKDMFEPQVLNKKIEFIFKCSKSIGFIYSDKNRIKQVIKNLLSNALKFVKEGSISFIVKDENENITISVKDDGIGIPKNKLEHIFNRFKQVDGSTTKMYGGTGLGLAISKELLDLLGGDIKVESQVDFGSTFTVTIPKKKDDLKDY